MQMRQEELQHRYNEFPDPIRALGYNAPQVRRVMDMYAHGQIITMQEALCRMVVALATESEAQQKEMINLAQRATFPPQFCVPSENVPIL